MKIRRIILHHSGTVGGNVAAINRAHIERGYATIGYHYVILNGNGGADGKVEIGRTTDQQGAHCKSNNNDSLGICVVGNWMEKVPTPKQYIALVNLLAIECNRYDLNPEGNYKHLLKKGWVISGHRDWNATDCPGDKFYALLPQLRIDTKQMGDKLWWGKDHYGCI